MLLAMREFLGILGLKYKVTNKSNYRTKKADLQISEPITKRNHLYF